MWRSTAYIEYKYKLSGVAQKSPFNNLILANIPHQPHSTPLPHTSHAPGAVDAHCREDKQV